MPADPAPQPVIDLAEARAAARRARDWATADRLRADIEAAGWRVVDAGTLYSLERVAPPDVDDGGVTRYGSSASVPSRLDDAPAGLATIVIVVDDGSPAPVVAVRALAEHAPDGTQLVIVADAPGRVGDTALADLQAVNPGAPGVVTEVIWTNGPLGAATARNAGVRRAATAVVMFLDPDVAVRGDVVSPLVEVLRDPTVAVAGPFGLVSGDLRRFRDAPVGMADVDAIRGAALAFRRSDFVALGPLDEHFETEDALDVWWSLVLRDGDIEGLGGGHDERRPRRAVQVAGLPMSLSGMDADDGDAGPDRARRARRDWYRVLKRFATRRDLLVGG